MDMRTLARRISLVEQRLSEIENSYGESLYRLERRTIRTNITISRIAEQMGVAVATDGEVDAVLDENGGSWPGS